MSKFSLVPYTLRIKRKKTNNYLIFNDISGHDFLSIIEDYLSTFIPRISVNSKTKEVLKISSLDKKDRTIFGRFDAGENGYGAKLLNVATDALSYERNPLDAELIPYYFAIRVPSKLSKGIVVLQGFRNLGIKTLFFNNFRQYIRDKFSNEYILEMDALVPSDLIRSYIHNNRVAKVRFIKQGYPRDIIDVSPDDIPDDEEFEGRCEFMLSAPRKGNLLNSFPSISRGIEKFLDSNNSSIHNLIEIKSFDYDNVKLEVKVGTSTRTIDLSDVDKVKYYDDISGIDIDINGHPKFDVLDSVAKAFLKEVAIALWGDDIND